jgi:hypothetical protein
VPLGDNTAATAWQHKGSATTSGPTAYLLQLQDLSTKWPTIVHDFGICLTHNSLLTLIANTHSHNPGS